MRRIPLVLSLLLASSAVFAQKEGVIVLKSDQPYVSPFDKSPSGGGPAATLFPNHTETPVAHPQGEAVGIKIFEPDEASKPVPAKPVVRKKEEPRVVKKEEPRVKKEEPRATKTEEHKSRKEPVQPKTELKAPQVEASVIPPKEGQNEKAALAPPPGLVLNEGGLTSFGKPIPEVSTPVASTLAPLTPEVKTPDVKAKVPALEAAVTAASVTAIVQGIEKPVDVTATSITKDDEVSSKATSGGENTLPGWVLKAFLFFVIGGLMMLGGWYWIKRQALYGDPAFQDPWFRPVKR